MRNNILKRRNLNKRHCPFNSVQVQIREGSWEGNKSDFGGKDLWKRWVLSLEWQGVRDGESEGDDCVLPYTLILYSCTIWYERRV